MNVDAAPGGNIQHCLGQNSAVGHHRNHIRLQSPQLLHPGRIPEAGGLVDRDPMGLGQLLHRGLGQLHPPVLGGIRLGIHRHHIKAPGEKSLQAGGGNLRCAHKYNAHRIPPHICSISSSVRKRETFSVYKCPSKCSSSWQKQRAISASPSASNQLPNRSCARIFT